MSELRVAARYAKSLIDLSVERNELEKVREDIISFLQTAKANPEFRAVLKNPIVPIEKKSKIVEALFGSKVAATTKSFFEIVIRKGRAVILYATAKEFIEQYNEKNNILRAKVKSAFELNSQAEAEILAIVEKATKKKIILEKSVDSKLIGGFILTVGDKQFDASIAKSLANLQKEFQNKQVNA